MNDVLIFLLSNSYITTKSKSTGHKVAIYRAGLHKWNVPTYPRICNGFVPFAALQRHRKLPKNY